LGYQEITLHLFMKNLITRRILKTSKYSINGLKAAWKSEEAFRIEVILLLALLPAAFFVGKSALEICLLVMSLFVVLIVELLNTGLEKAIDRISMDVNDISGFVKDVGSAAVAISIIQALIVWAVIYFTNR
jgi:diacylglycerol kinase (ATP)